MQIGTPLSKKQLLIEIKRFCDDKDRGIGLGHFCEICGIAEDTLKSVFIKQTDPMSEYVQVRVNKGYAEWKAGNVRVMVRPDRTKFVEYRKRRLPPILPDMRLQLSDGQLKLRIGPKNRHDYSVDSLDEQLRG
jgi:hypothetical protein